MCRSNDCGGRRCPMNSAQRNAYNARRRRNRAAKKKLATYFESKDMPLTAAEVMKTQPSNIPVIMDSLGIKDALSDDEMPGVQNGSEPDISSIVDAFNGEIEGVDSPAEEPEPEPSPYEAIDKDSSVSDIISLIAQTEDVKTLDEEISKSLAAFNDLSSRLEGKMLKKERLALEAERDKHLYAISNVIENGNARNVLLASIGASTIDEVLQGGEDRILDSSLKVWKDAYSGEDMGEMTSVKPFGHIDFDSLTEETHMGLKSYVDSEGKRVAKIDYSDNVIVYGDKQGDSDIIRISGEGKENLTPEELVKKALNQEYEIPSSIAGKAEEGFIIGTMMGHVNMDEDTTKIANIAPPYKFHMMFHGDKSEKIDSYITFANARDYVHGSIERGNPSDVGLTPEVYKTIGEYGYIPVSSEEDIDMNLDKVSSIFAGTESRIFDNDESRAAVTELVKQSKKAGIIAQKDLRASIKDYTGSLYDPVNKYFNGRAHADILAGDYNRKAASLMDASDYLSKNPGNIPVTRVRRNFKMSGGGGLSNDELFKSMFKEGGVVQSSGMMSTSSSPFHSGFGNYHMDIITDTGIPVRAMSNYQHEEEVILPRGIKLRVLMVDEENQTVKLIEESLYQKNKDKWSGEDYSVDPTIDKKE